jgi:hypothetical protein
VRRLSIITKPPTKKGISFLSIWLTTAKCAELTCTGLV